MDISKEFGMPGILSYRRNGELARQRVKEIIDQEACSSEMINLDFSGIYLIDLSFADEFILQLRKELKDEESNDKKDIRDTYRILYLTNASNELVENIEGAISLREIKTKEQLPILLKNSDGEFKFLGEIELNLEETWSLLKSRERINTYDVVAAFNIAPNNAGTRLKKLYDLRLVARSVDSDNRKLQSYFLPS